MGGSAINPESDNSGTETGCVCVCVCVCVCCVLEGGCNDFSFGFEVLLRPAGKNVKLKVRV